MLEAVSELLATYTSILFRALVVGGGTGLLLATSGYPVRAAFTYIDEQYAEKVETRSGTVIGKAENVLVVLFVLLQAYTALAIIFALEGIVTRDQDVDTGFVLAGTMVNFTYSLLFALGIDAIFTLF